VLRQGGVEDKGGGGEPARGGGGDAGQDRRQDGRGPGQGRGQGGGGPGCSREEGGAGAGEGADRRGRETCGRRRRWWRWGRWGVEGARGHPGADEGAGGTRTRDIRIAAAGGAGPASPPRRRRPSWGCGRAWRTRRCCSPARSSRANRLRARGQRRFGAGFGQAEQRGTCRRCWRCWRKARQTRCRSAAPRAQVLGIFGAAGQGRGCRGWGEAAQGRRAGGAGRWCGVRRWRRSAPTRCRPSRKLIRDGEGRRRNRRCAAAALYALGEVGRAAPNRVLATLQAATRRPGRGPSVRPPREAL